MDRQYLHHDSQKDPLNWYGPSNGRNAQPHDDQGSVDEDILDYVPA